VRLRGTSTAPRALFLAGFLAACSGTPPVSTPVSPATTDVPATAEPTTEPVPSTSPTPAPTATAAPILLEAPWTLGKLPTVGNAGVWTGQGWVAVGTGCPGGCDSFDETGLTSADGISWKATPMAEDAGSYLREVVLAGGKLYAVGEVHDSSGVGDATRSALIWESIRGNSWDLVSTIDLGTCNL
jgi:hypothetical protein